MMSDFNPTPGSFQQVGNAAENLLETIYNKLNTAEAATQYRTAYEMLRKGTIDFNNSLATDPNHDTYLDRWNAQKDALWKQATAMVKNPDAMSQLQDAWSQMDIQQYQNITGMQTKARIQDTYNRAATTEQAIMQDPSTSSEDRKKKIRDLWSPLVTAGIITQDDANKYYLADDKVIDMNTAIQTVKDIAHSNLGWDSAIAAIDAPDFAAKFPSLTEDDLNTLQKKMESQQLFEEGQVKKQNDAILAGIDDKLNKALGAFIDGKPGALNTDLIEAQPFPLDDTSQNKKKEWLSMFNTLLREKDNAPLRPEVALIVDQMMADPNVSPAGKQSLLMKFAEKGLVPANSLRTYLSQATGPAFNPYWKDMVDEITALTRKDNQGNDAILSAEQGKNVLDGMQRMMRANPDMGVTDLMQKRDELVNIEKDKSIHTSVNALFNAMQNGEFRDWMDVPDINSLVTSMDKAMVKDYTRASGKNPVSVFTDDNGESVIDDGKLYWRAKISFGRISWYTVPHGQENDPSAWKLTEAGNIAQRAMGGVPFSVGSP